MGERMFEVSTRVGQILDLEPARRAVEFRHRWYSWGDLASMADSIERHIEPGTRVGVLLRNRPAHVGLFIGLLRAGASVVTIDPDRGNDRVAADIGTLDLPVVAGDPADTALFADSLPATRMVASNLDDPLEVAASTEGDGAHRNPGVAVEMLTSGTTGPPKRIPLTYDTLWRVLVGAKHYERNAELELRLRSGVAVVNSPLVHLGGLFRVLQCVNDGRAFCLLEKFRVDEWADAVRRHRPSTASLVPAALRMVLEADLNRDDLSSLRSVVSGTAPLSPEDADEFFEKYGVPVLIAYAATEFGGGVAGWNLADHEKYWKEKRGSVGRPHAGCELRIVDPATGQPLAPNEEGLLEVKALQLGVESGWTRTTDLARIDDDGFLWILGRADLAIIRGGYKVHPDQVRAAIERDPRVRGAAVVGQPDPRLGAVPVAAVELRPGSPQPTSEELLATSASVLARYELPAELRIVDTLPRTPSGKVDLHAVRGLFQVR
jgi:acyl-CoA synthetase (AMP-forming)/AMP-acid ligase II